MKTKQKIQAPPKEKKVNKDIMNNQNYILGKMEKKIVVANKKTKKIKFFMYSIINFVWSMDFISLSVWLLGYLTISLLLWWLAYNILYLLSVNIGIFGFILITLIPFIFFIYFDFFKNNIKRVSIKSINNINNFIFHEKINKELFIMPIFIAIMYFLFSASRTDLMLINYNYLFVYIFGSIIWSLFVFFKVKLLNLLSLIILSPIYVILFLIQLFFTSFEKYDIIKQVYWKISLKNILELDKNYLITKK